MPIGHAVTCIFATLAADRFDAGDDYRAEADVGGGAVQRSVRPWITAGVAILGASVIAVAPLEPVPHSEMRIANAALELSAAPNPFQYYPQVVMRSFTNAGDRLSQYFSDPLPIAQAIIDNQHDALADIVDAAARLDPVALVRAILRAFAQPVVNLVKVLGTGEPFETAASLLVRLALPIVGGAFAGGTAIGDAVKALLDLDVVGAINAALNIPARVVDGMLNGRIDGVTEGNFGLLTPVVGAPVAEQLTGPVDFLIDSLQNIGDTISTSPPSAMGPVAQIPDGAAPAITLDVTPESTGSQDDPATEPAPRDTHSGDAPEPDPEPEPSSSDDDSGQEPDDADPPDQGGAVQGSSVAPSDEPSDDSSASGDDDGGSSEAGDGDASGDSGADGSGDQE